MGRRCVEDREINRLTPTGGPQPSHAEHQPSPYPWPMYEAFTAALTKAGMKEAGARVFVSGIPIRS
jgi:hypothetical protein